jgi:hypothetical protein
MDTTCDIPRDGMGASTNLSLLQSVYVLRTNRSYQELARAIGDSEQTIETCEGSAQMFESIYSVCQRKNKMETRRR